MGGLGIITTILVTAGVTYFTALSMHGGGGTCLPMQLSGEVKSYIDKKVVSGPSESTAEVAKLMSRVAEMEKKLADVERVNSAYEGLQKKNSLIEAAIEEQSRKQDALLSGVRQQEATTLRNQMAAICAGVVVKKDQGSPGAKTR